MYNFSGIVYNLVLWSYGILFGVGLIIKSKIFDKRTRKKFKITSRHNKLRMIGYLLLGAAFIIGGLCFVVNNAYALKNPKIESFEGYYERVYGRPTSYLFENESESADLHLDFFSKRKIYPKAFEKDTLYKVFYEARTKVIVRIEALETGD